MLYLYVLKEYGSNIELKKCDCEETTKLYKTKKFFPRIYLRQLKKENAGEALSDNSCVYVYFDKRNDEKAKSLISEYLYDDYAKRCETLDDYKKKIDIVKENGIEEE